MERNITTTKEKCHGLLQKIDQRQEHLRQAAQLQREAWDITKKIRKQFTEKEYTIFKARNFERKTLEEVGRTFGITRERVRQIEEKILEKIKNIS